MSKSQNTNQQNTNAAPKRRGRTKGSTTPATMEISILLDEKSDPNRMAVRLENTIDDGGADVTYKVTTDIDRVMVVAHAADGPNARTFRLAIAKTLRKWHAKKRILAASIVTNPIRIG